MLRIVMTTCCARASVSEDLASAEIKNEIRVKIKYRIINNMPETAATFIGFFIVGLVIIYI